MKYGIWKIKEPEVEAVNSLVGSGYAPLAAMVIASRGVNNAEAADRRLSCRQPLVDPFRMKDMALAVKRVALALERKEKIAVFGDYDVDGITSTCLLTDFLRRQGADCVPYIPGRLEEGYGLNPIAIRQLWAEGVKLIVTVDCGITAVEEALLCKELGIDLVITDHHECKESLPEACAVVDPHRPDCTYPHKTLSGVGVAFKLAGALCGDQEQILSQYADMVCLGTVADVMPLTGENRVFVSRGLEALQQTNRPGIAALMEQAGCMPESLTASSVGYTLAPRINAAGRMGKIDLAVRLFLTEDPEEGEALAKALCDLNRQRQAVESEIYEQAISMLPEGKPPAAIVLADDTWHQGVVGIVASRIAEEYCCPAFLICLDGEHGKASSRSYGGFNLFSALSELSDLLESYGGHELAAGFTIRADRIPAFREAICARAEAFYREGAPRTVLEADCAIRPELMTVYNIESLRCLEPCGNGCPKPVLVMEDVQVERITPVGGGKHLRLRLRRGQYSIPGIFFSATAESASVTQGDMVDVAFAPQINEFRGERSVQMNILDIRPNCQAECPVDGTAYYALCNGSLTPGQAAQLLPERSTLATVWRYLANSRCTELQEHPICLCRKIVRWSGMPLGLDQMMTCLDIFRDVGLLEKQDYYKHITLRPIPQQEKKDLTESQTMRRLIALKES